MAAAMLDSYSEAVVFFERNQVAREMLYSEFEAILDGVVPVSDKASARAQAVYLRIDMQLCITAAVFFLIDFDEKGFADKRWNVPLEQFAESAARGPDLGAGPIRLACRSQCGIAWHQQQLWDPDMSPGSNNFVLLRKAIQRNRLRLPYRSPEEVEPPVLGTTQVIDSHALERQLSQKLESRHEQELRNHTAQMLKEQRLRILTLNSQHKEELHRLQLEHQHRLQEYQEKIEQMRQLLEDEQQRNQQLKQTIEGQASKIEGVREYFEHKLKTAKSVEISQLQALRTNYEMELEAKLEAATTELKEMLQMREVELMYRNEQASNLHEEIARLRHENQLLLSNGGDQLLEKIARCGVSFVAYHPGLGHLTIPLVDMARYLEAPVAFAAERCGVSERQYNEWLAHYKTPCCQALGEHGEVCGKALLRVESPSDFHVGESDRCGDHQTSVTQTFAAVRG